MSAQAILHSLAERASVLPRSGRAVCVWEAEEEIGESIYVTEQSTRVESSKRRDALLLPHRSPRTYPFDRSLPLSLKGQPQRFTGQLVVSWIDAVNRRDRLGGADELLQVL